MKRIPVLARSAKQLGDWLRHNGVSPAGVVLVCDRDNLMGYAEGQMVIVLPDWRLNPALDHAWVREIGAARAYKAITGDEYLRSRAVPTS